MSIHWFSFVRAVSVTDPLDRPTYSGCAARRSFSGTRVSLQYQACSPARCALRCKSSPLSSPSVARTRSVLCESSTSGFCTRTSKATVVVTSVGEFKVTKTLDALDVRLAPHGFFRAHRSYVVNLEQIRNIITWSRNAYTLMLHCNREVPLSKHRIGALRRMLRW